jgi:hypothetical protein
VAGNHWLVTFVFVVQIDGFAQVLFGGGIRNDFRLNAG